MDTEEEWTNDTYQPRHFVLAKNSGQKEVSVAKHWTTILAIYTLSNKDLSNKT